MKVALAEAAGRLEITEAVPTLLAQLKNDGATEVRLASLRALQALKVPDIDQVMKTGAGRQGSGGAEGRARHPARPRDVVGRQGAAALLPDQVRFARRAAGRVRGPRHAPHRRITRALGQFLDEFEAGKIAPEVQVDLVDAAQADGFAGLRVAARGVPQGPLARKRSRSRSGRPCAPAATRSAASRRSWATLPRSAPAATPLEGANVGPNLAKIGTTLSRDQIVEALLEPSARIAPGFGMVTLTLRKGDKVVGTLRDETPTDVVLVEGTPPVERRVAKTDIADRSNPVSPMPPYGLILKRARDPGHRGVPSTLK